MRYGTTGKTKVNKDSIIIRISIFDTNHTVELFAATQTAEALTGLLAEIGRKIKEEVELRVSGRGRVVNININKSKIDRSNLLDLCNMDGTCDVNIVIDKSEIDRINVGSSKKYENDSQGNDHTVNTDKRHQVQSAN